MVYLSARAPANLANSVSMGSQAAAHFAHLRRLAFTKEVQQMAFTFVKYGSAVYCFRTYVMALTAVIFEPKCLGLLLRLFSRKTLESGRIVRQATFKVHIPYPAVHGTEYVSNTQQQGRHPTTAILAAVF